MTVRKGIKLSFRVLAVTLLPLLLAGQEGALEWELERSLLGTLQWEILWYNLPAYQVPAKVSRHVTLQIAFRPGTRTRVEENLFFCSRDLGVCKTYFRGPVRNLEGVFTAPYPRSAQPEEAIRAFVQHRLTVEREMWPTLVSRAAPVLWEFEAKLPSRAEILREYSGGPSEQSRSLRDALAVTTRDSGYSTLRVACSKPTDPAIPVYGIRRKGPPIVFWEIFQRDAGGCTYAYMTERAHNPRMFDRLKATIEQVTCEAVRFP